MLPMNQVKRGRRVDLSVWTLERNGGFNYICNGIGLGGVAVAVTKLGQYHSDTCRCSTMEMMTRGRRRYSVGPFKMHKPTKKNRDG